MNEINFYRVQEGYNLDDVKQETRNNEVESYYNISWKNNQRDVNVAFQGTRKFEKVNPIIDGISEEQVLISRNFWKDLVLKLRFKSIPHWSVKHRKAPLISTSKLFMKVSFKDLLEQNVGNSLHWGSNNFLAIIEKQIVRIVHLDYFQNIYTFYKKYFIALKNNKIGICLRWNRAATCIAIAAQEKEVEVWNPEQQKCKISYRCECEIETCRIESLEWSNSDELVTGCSSGCLSIYSSNDRLICKRIHAGPIIKLTFSCNDQYLATSSADKAVKIWTMPNLVQLYTFNCNKPVKAIAWHPWTEHHFAIGGYTPDSLVTLWNARKRKCVQELTGVSNNGSDIFTVKDLTFNPTSGELVVNYAVSEAYDIGNANRGLIFVYSNFLSMVDMIHWHDVCILYLLWNNDGSKLISLDITGKGAVWDFLGDFNETFIKPAPYFSIENIYKK